jgi:hypothetical protein
MLNARERFNDPEETAAQRGEGDRSKVHTAYPVVIKKHDRDQNTVNVQVAIKVNTLKPDGTTEWREIPQLKDLPIQYLGGGGATITMPVKDGDEALVVFSSRSIDKWWQQGGVQEQTDARMHDLSDGFVLPGFRSQPRKLNNVSEDSVQLRTDDSKHVIELNPVTGKITIKSDNPVEVPAPLMRVIGDVIARAGSGNVSLATHTHGTGPPPNGGTSGGGGPGGEIGDYVISFNTRTGEVVFLLQDLLAVGGAPLNSPIFTGYPAGPTAPVGTNTIQFATTEFVTRAITRSVAGVVSFNNRNGAVTLLSGDVFTALTYIPAPTSSPTFTGTPRGPTAAPNTNTTQLATTEFVTRAITAGIGGGGFGTMAYQNYDDVDITGGDINGIVLDGGNF